MILSVQTDFARFRQTLDDLGKRQLPYAAALALTRTARRAAEDVTRKLPEIFDAKGKRPTPFTMRAIGSKGARKSNLRAEVFVKQRQAEYLGIEETGGTRASRPGAPVLMPVDIARNVYGNIPRGRVRRLAANPERYFLGTVRGVYGLWERRGPSRLRLLVAFRSEADYRPRFGFRRRVASSVKHNFMSALRDGMQRAIETARH